MKAVIIRKDMELGRAKLEEFEDQTAILISEGMTDYIEGLLIDSPDVGELGEVSADLIYKKPIERDFLDSHYEESRENKQEIKYRSLSLNQKHLPKLNKKQNLVRNKNSLQRRNKNSKV